MSTTKRKILCGGSVLLALLLTACSGAIRLNSGATLLKEPGLSYLPEKPGFVLNGASLRNIVFALSDRAESVRIFRGHDSRVTSVVFSPDGRRALSGGIDKTLRLWDIATGKSLRTFRGHRSEVMSVAFNPDNLRALSGSQDGTLRLWDLATGKSLRIFRGHSSAVNAVAISPDGRRALSGSEDKTLRLWDLETGNTLQIFRGHADAVNDVAFSPDGRYALSGSDDANLRLWNVRTGKFLRIYLGHVGGVYGIAFSPDGRHVLSASGDQTLILWNSKPPVSQKIGTFMIGLLQTEEETARSQKAMQDLRASIGDENLQLKDIRNRGKPLRTFKGHTDSYVGAVAFSPDGRRALSGSGDKTLRFWDLETTESFRTFRGHTNDVFDVALSPDGRLALSASADGTLRLWQLLHPGFSFKQLQATFQEKAQRLWQQRVEDFAGPPVLSDSDFESPQMLEKRRKARITKVQEFEKHHEKELLSTRALVFQEVYGHPFLQALVDGQGIPRYDSEKQQMTLSFRYQNANESQEMNFQVPPDDSAEKLYSALQAGSAATSAEYLVKDGEPILDAIYVHHDGNRYPGVLAKD